MDQGPFPGSILVAATAVLAGLGFIGSKLYKAKAPEVRKVGPRCVIAWGGVGCNNQQAD